MTKLQRVRRKARSLGIFNEINISTRKNNKFMAKVGKKWVHFGHKDYEDFLDHKNKDRRISYLARARGIRNGKGELTHKNKEYANFWSIHILW